MRRRKGCGLFSKCGYGVTALVVSQHGVVKAKPLAAHNKVNIRFFKADIFDYRPDTEYDIIFSSGTLHFVPEVQRKELFDRLKVHTADKGIHAMNVFVEKPFIDPAPDLTQEEEKGQLWRSGELFTYYHDWLFHACKEEVFDCNSGGIPHKHCMDTLIAQRCACSPLSAPPSGSRASLS